MFSVSWLYKCLSNLWTSPVTLSTLVVMVFNRLSNRSSCFFITSSRFRSSSPLTLAGHSVCPVGDDMPSFANLTVVELVFGHRLAECNEFARGTQTSILANGYLQMVS